jgi:hypothetical protein
VPFAAHFLADERHRKERREIVRSNGFTGSGMQNRGWRRRQVGDDIVPGLGNPVLAKEKLRLLVHAFSSTPGAFSTLAAI